MNFILPIPGGKIAVPYFITVISVLMISVSIFNMADTAMSGGVHIYDNTQGNLLEKEEFWR
ncbi:MAG: hypothetical protein J6P79_09180 [Pseudobutyrivibrio sp.]|nr:hypothetical protein [Pseudobutyrivibrio sp.]